MASFLFKQIIKKKGFLRIHCIKDWEGINFGFQSIVQPFQKQKFSNKVDDRYFDVP